jgi:ribosomal protein S27E
MNIVTVTEAKRPLNFNCTSCGTPMFLGKPRKTPKALVKPARVRCPGCQEINETTNPVRPLTLQCEYCGMPLLLRGKARPRPTPRSRQAAQQKKERPKGVIIKCPECSKKMNVINKKRPLKFNCTLCGRELMLK